MIKTGDRVYIGTRGGNENIPASVLLASSNGRSLMLEFEAVIALPNGSMFVGSMPVFQLEDGRWIEIVGSHEIIVREAI